MQNCSLCFNLTFKKNLLPVDQIQDCGESIKSVVEKYFWFSDKIHDATKTDEDKWVCKTCWKRLEDFHEFFSNVKYNYKIAETILRPAETVQRCDAEDQEALVERLDDEWCSNDEDGFIETTVDDSTKLTIHVPDIWNNVANKRKYGKFVDILERFTEIPKKKLRLGDKPKAVEKYRFSCRICRRVNTGFVGTTGPIRSHLRRIHDFDLQKLDAAISMGDFESRVYIRKKRPPTIDSDSAPSEVGEGPIEALDNDE